MKRTTLYRRPNGYWYTLTVLPNGRKQWKSCKTRRKPDVLLDVVPRVGEVTLRDFFRTFLATAPTRYSSKTVVMYRRYLRLFSECVGDVLLAEVTTADLDRYVQQRLAQDVSQVTLSVELRTIKAAFSWAYRRRMLDWSPFNAMRIETRRVPPEHLTEAEFEALVLAIRQPWLQDVVLFTAGTGLRLSEVLAIRWQDVDLMRNEVTIRSYATFRTKKDTVRTVALSEMAQLVLRHRMPVMSSERVFYEHGQSWVSHAFTRYARKAVPHKRIHFHTLRHSYATWLAQRGVRIEAIQRLLGHSSPTVTQIYAHLTGSDLHGEVKKIPLVTPKRNEGEVGEVGSRFPQPIGGKRPRE